MCPPPIGIRGATATNGNAASSGRRAPRTMSPAEKRADAKRRIDEAREKFLADTGNRGVLAALSKR
jgi:hypothetical protein